MKGKRGVDFSNCYYANLWKLLEMEEKDSQEWVLVHAVREMAAEWWGGHAFLLNKKTNKILDFSNQKKLEGTKEELFKQWNIQEDGDRMYFEYTKQQCLNKVAEHMTHGSWDLLFEDWQNKAWAKYMSEYFIPKYQPIMHKQRTEKEGVV
tara:strand:- start:7072 stop:7521 length:450 start_codon:yes stop_codon:yes gene_type:complete